MLKNTFDERSKCWSHQSRDGEFLLRRNGIFFAFSGESIKCFFLGREIFLLLDSNAFECVRNQYICVYLLFFSVQLKH